MTKSLNNIIIRNALLSIKDDVNKHRLHFSLKIRDIPSVTIKAGITFTLIEDSVLFYFDGLQHITWDKYDEIIKEQSI